MWNDKAVHRHYKYTSSTMSVPFPLAIEARFSVHEGIKESKVIGSDLSDKGLK